MHFVSLVDRSVSEILLYPVKKVLLCVLIVHLQGIMELVDLVLYAEVLEESINLFSILVL